MSDAEAIERASTLLVQRAPDLAPELIDELVERLRHAGTPLALALGRVVELVALGLVDPGIALPAIAMACATLAEGLRGKLGEAAQAAARFEIETLMPLPEHGPRPTIVVPDVPVTALRRR